MGALAPFSPPSVLLNETRCPHSDQRALAALITAVNEASCTWPIITELAVSLGQTPAAAAGVGQVGPCLSSVLMDERKQSLNESQDTHRAVPYCGCHYGAAGEEGGPRGQTQRWYLQPGLACHPGHAMAGAAGPFPRACLQLRNPSPAHRKTRRAAVL